MSTRSAVARAIKLAGGQRKVAASFRIGQPAVSAWIKRGWVPINRCVPLSEMTGGRVQAERLNPELAALLRAARSESSNVHHRP